MGGQEITDHNIVIDVSTEAQADPNTWTWWSRAKDSIQIPVPRNCHVGYFRISLSLCTQALLWKTLVSSTSTEDGHAYTLDSLPSTALILLWSLSLFTLSLTCLAYAFKCLLHFSAVKREFLHHVGVNYFYAPWTSALLLLHASPVGPAPPSATWALLLVAPVVALDVKIYGQWLTKGKRFLSRVANPASQLSVIANLVAAAQMEASGWREFGLFLFSVGMAHYLVLFVTLYQRLPGGDGLPANLRPVFFLFIATPSMASLAWKSINGTFDSAAKMLFFLSLFLFVSLGCRPTLFKKSMKSFSVAWWSYAFSVTLLALAAYEYAHEVKTAAAHALMLLLSILSMLLLFVLLVFTVFNADTLLFGTQHHPSSTTTNGSTSAIK
ncbi:hypothetical protein V2J09_003930 [Rumex salicifolius]